jgi:putative ABC transport system substrate-binding protein
VVYSAVTDPVAAKLVKGWEASGTNVTGVRPRPGQASRTDQEGRSQRQRVGVIYSPE